MLSWRIFSHSVKLVFRNLKHALPISMPVIFVAIVQNVFQPTQMALDPTTASDVLLPSTMQTMSLLFGLAQYIAGIWSAVAWHRFVLLEEYPTTVLPRWYGSQMLRYAMLGLLLGLILMALSSIVGLIAVMLGAMLGLGVAVVLGLGMGLYLGVFWLRMAAVLPSRAIGEKLSISDAIAATKGASLAFMGLLVIFIIAVICWMFVVLPLLFVSPVLVLAVGIPTQWVAWMASISTLTTIHGIYIEGRSIE